MSCLKLQVGTLKQCLEKVDGHPGDCIFTLLRPEVAAAQDKRKERDNQLVRRNLADGYIPALMGAYWAPESESPNESGRRVVDLALTMADDLIAKTGGFGP
jgi:hypothetical protein